MAARLAFPFLRLHDTASLGWPRYKNSCNFSVTSRTDGRAFVRYESVGCPGMPSRVPAGDGIYLARHASAGCLSAVGGSPEGTALVAHTYNANFVHLIFSTKGRANLIPSAWQPKLWAYLLGIATNLKIRLFAAGGTANHVHLLVGLPATMPVAEAVQKFKANSSRWLGENQMKFQWQEGYAAFSVSPSLRGTVQKYIRNQAEHHHKRSFEEEFRAFLEKSGVALDENLFAA